MIEIPDTELPAGYKVFYDNGTVSGFGEIVGIASTPVPPLGRLYIIKSDTIRNDVYQYDYFTIHEHYFNKRKSKIENIINDYYIEKKK